MMPRSQTSDEIEEPFNIGVAWSPTANTPKNSKMLAQACRFMKVEQANILEAQEFNDFIIAFSVVRSTAIELNEIKNKLDASEYKEHSEFVQTVCELLLTTKRYKDKNKTINDFRGYELIITKKIAPIRLPKKKNMGCRRASHRESKLCLSHFFDTAEEAKKMNIHHIVVESLHAPHMWHLLHEDPAKRKQFEIKSVDWIAMNKATVMYNTFYTHFRKTLVVSNVVSE